jgi:soluble lytic murein transglycosylase-like protein
VTDSGIRAAPRVRLFCVQASKSKTALHAVRLKCVRIKCSLMRWLGPLVFLLSGSVFAGEYAVLTNGARLSAERHEFEGSKVRLYSSGGFIEMSAAEIQGFEKDDPAPPEAVGPAAQPALSPQQLVDAAAEKYGLPRDFVRSMVAAESSFQPAAISPKGAIGLMQLMPATARTLGADPRDAAQNVDAGVRYLRDLLVQYGGGVYHALAAYNAGPAAVEKYHGVPPYRETVDYIKRIAEQFQQSPR